jgi:DNA-binding response OmpR family regulator
MTGETPLVLVVEDDAELASLYEAWLADEYRVRTAIGGREAFDELDDAIDVVLLDRRMPEVSGDDVLAEIRERGLDARVAMVTAVEPDADIIDMPFDDYLVKPVSRADLLQTVDDLLLRSDYDERVRDLFSLASKKAVLESEDSTGALAANPEYERLDEELADLQTELDRTVEAMAGDDEYERLFSDIDTPERN